MSAIRSLIDNFDNIEDTSVSGMCHLSKLSSAEGVVILINSFSNYQRGVQFYHRQVQYIVI
jgi:hypothetical protein